ncbi:DinB family protein [Amycolatopsis nigrescens]|uniref:DinB family protein n=1 Tax=Amycolatopsis nigrescens TaxID=381445 RepID=UPI0003790728|nr:DinB family protein [Amycolatopsis nigrescens]
MTDPLELAVHNTTADERAMLEAFLDNYRAIAVSKLSGVSEADARRRLVPSATTLGGLLKHLRWVELNWFQRVVAAVPEDELPPPPWSDADPDADFRIEDDETVESIIAEYDAECARSRKVARAHELAHTGTHRVLGDVSLRWVYLHLIEETARHCGHADILREQLDGTVGPEI